MNKSVSLYKNFNKFVLRTPLLPYSFFESVTANRVIDTEEIKNICIRPHIKEALFLASPDLFFKIQKWQENNITDKKEIEKLEFSILKYFFRMTTRCTQFGLFAGCTIGEFSNENNIRFPGMRENARHTRLDMNYLCALALDLAKKPEISENIKFYPNSSIYKVGEQLRYVEFRYVKSKRTHHIVAVDDSEYLHKILQIAEKGAYKKELIESLIDGEITKDDAGDFIYELINSQLLVHDLEPTITGPEFLDQILRILKPIGQIEEIKSSLQFVKKQLKIIDSSPIGHDTNSYLNIAEKVKELATDYELKYLFQSDMIKTAQNCTLGKEIINDVMKAIRVMNQLSIAPQKTNITEFKDKFYARYKEAEVPLQQALDIESGIGYLQNNSSTTGDLAPLVDDLLLPTQQTQNYDIRWNKIQSFLLKKYNESLIHNKKEIEITEQNLKELELKENWDDLPLTLSSMVRIIANSSEDKPYIYLSSASGSSAANLLGRFSHADPEIHNYVLEITQKEEEIEPDAIFAEIIHLPEARLGNILLRPVLRKYEIPYLAKAAVDTDHQIKVEDLMIAVRNNKIILRSKKLNKQILPRLSTAHNYSFNALPLYQFLCDLQTQHLRSGVFFSWGSLDNEFDFYPRVIYKNVILSRAYWNIKNKSLENIYKIKEDELLFDTFTKWREKYAINSTVVLADGDNELSLNLENLTCVKLLLNQVKRRSSFKLTEFLVNKDPEFCTSNDGVFTNEFVISFYKSKMSNGTK